jgi:hypothetical protein
VSQPFESNQDPAWCIAYLKGRIAAYRKGNLGLGSVRGAIRLAERRHVSVADIVQAVRAGGLVYDPNEGVRNTSADST